MIIPGADKRYEAKKALWNLLTLNDLPASFPANFEPINHVYLDCTLYKADLTVIDLCKAHCFFPSTFNSD